MRSKSFIFELLIIIISGISIILNFILFKDWKGILYYTIISNLFVFIFYTVTLIKRIKGILNKKDSYYILKGLLLLSILCTMFMYNIFIASGSTIYEGHPIISSTVHIIVPIMVLIDCLFFGNGKVLKYSYIIFWEISIVLYFLIINIYRLFGGKFLEGKNYPYDIINYELLGVGKVTINCIMILMIYAIIGIIIVFVNNKMKVKKVKGE